LESHLQKELEETVIPFLLRTAAIILLFGGILGLLFFLSVLFFSIDGSNFPNYFRYNDNKNIVFTTFVIVQLVIHLGFIISSVQLIKLKKTGVYIFIACFIMFIISKLFYSDFSVFLEILFGVFILIFLMISWKSLK